MLRSSSCGLNPRPTDSEPCGSKSTSSTFRPSSASAAPRLMVVVVLPTPPFWLHIASTSAGPCSVSGGGSGRSGIGRPVGPISGLPAPDSESESSDGVDNPASTEDFFTWASSPYAAAREQTYCADRSWQTSRHLDSAAVTLCVALPPIKKPRQGDRNLCTGIARHTQRTHSMGTILGIAAGGATTAGGRPQCWRETAARCRCRCDFAPTLAYATSR